MNRRWTENLIIFAVVLDSTRSDSWIKIRVSRARLKSTMSQTWSKLPKIFERFGFDVKLWKVPFWGDFDFVWLSVNPGLTRGILVILTKEGTLGVPMSEWVAPCHFGCSRNPRRENNIFGFFEIRHTDLGRTKYGIKNYDYIRLFLTLRNSPDMSYSRFMTILLINLVNLVIWLILVLRIWLS